MKIFLRILAQQLLIPLFLLIYKCDAIYCPINSAPLLTFKPVFLKINTLHHIDLPKEFPVGFFRKIYRNIMFGLSAKKQKLLLLILNILKIELLHTMVLKMKRLKFLMKRIVKVLGFIIKNFRENIF